ncbi:hypothetical protein PEKONANI_01770 [Aeromonas jandaei]|uniref:DUF1972 domain-containing protein n=1 Tax=Aeromonas jandaei TaxID=650 RepID=UPI0036704AEE
MKTVAIVGTVGLPACYGGWETLVENIVKKKSEDIDYLVFCSSTSYENKINFYEGARLVYLPISANGIASIIYDGLSLIHTLFKKPDAVVVLGVSGCIFFPIYKLFSNSKLILNVDGIEWKRDKWSRFAKAFLKFSEYIGVKWADVIIADNEGIGHYIKNEYGASSEVIAYGGEHALVSGAPAVIESKYDYFFTVCRIEPENNVAMILEAFVDSGVNYKIIGNWSSSLYGIQLKEKYSHHLNIDLIDPVYDLKVLFNYRRGCKGYIHGHSVGGTNPSLVEIMHFGKQIYAFDCVFNRLTTEDQAVYFSSAEELRKYITATDLLVDNESMKEIALRRYTWSVVAKQYESLYGN